VTQRSVTILFVGGDGPASIAVTDAARAERGLILIRAPGLADARTLAGRGVPDAILAEPELPDGEAGDMLKIFPDIPLTLVTENPEGAFCDRGLDAGAFDWVRPRELEAGGLRRTAERALRVRRILEDKAGAERALRQKGDLLDRITRNSGVGVVVISRDYRTLWASEHMAELFGPVVGRPCYSAYNRREEVCPGCGVRKVFETGQDRVVHEQQGFDAQGNRIWSQIVAAPVLDEHGEVSAAVELVIPITDRKRAEEALRESETRYRRLSQEFHAVLDAIPDNLTLQSPDLCILWANRGAAENLGRETGDLVGRHCYEVWHDRSEPCDECPVRRCFNTGVPAVECVVTPDQRAWELRAVPIRRDDGEVSSVVEAGREITAHRSAEFERERLIRRLESKNAVLEQFTHTVSHDLKTPLTTIRGFASLLLRELDEGRIDRVRRYGIQIGQAGEQMQQLLEQLLELSRAGRLTATLEPVPLGEVVRDALSNLAGPIGLRRAGVHVAPNLPVVRGDRVRLREVVENLVGNALKFAGSHPAPRVEIGVRPGSAGPVYFVRDNGIGIEAEDQRRIFGLFHKLDPEAEGSGVGLAIVKRIVEAHGGTVWVESDGAGRGSTFCFTLGRASGAAAERGER